MRLTAKTVECFYKGQRVASHVRSFVSGRHTTVANHMPLAHRSYAEWTAERVLAWTTSAGPFTRKAAECILASRLNPQQAFRSCLGLMRLGKIYGPERLEAASKRAIHYQAASYRSINSILKNRLDEKPIEEEAPVSKPISHPNIRGSAYYEGESSC